MAKDRTWPTDFSDDELLAEAKDNIHKLTSVGPRYAQTARESLEEFCSALEDQMDEATKDLEKAIEFCSREEIKQLKEEIENLEKSRELFLKNDKYGTGNGGLMKSHINDLIKRKQARITELARGLVGA
jgi:recombinational DNA repair protein RecR